MVEDAFTKLTEGILQHGPAGLIILCLLLTIIALARFYLKSVELRLAEAMAMVKVIESNTSALRSSVTASEEQSRTRETLITAITLLKERIEQEGINNRERLERLERSVERRHG